MKFKHHFANKFKAIKCITAIFSMAVFALSINVTAFANEISIEMAVGEEKVVSEIFNMGTIPDFSDDSIDISAHYYCNAKVSTSSNDKFVSPTDVNKLLYNICYDPVFDKFTVSSVSTPKYYLNFGEKEGNNRSMVNDLQSAQIDICAADGKSGVFEISHNGKKLSLSKWSIFTNSIKDIDRQWNSEFIIAKKTSDGFSIIASVEELKYSNAQNNEYIIVSKAVEGEFEGKTFALHPHVDNIEGGLVNIAMIESSVTIVAKKIGMTSFTIDDTVYKISISDDADYPIQRYINLKVGDRITFQIDSLKYQLPQENVLIATAEKFGGAQIWSDNGYNGNFESLGNYTFTPTPVSGAENSYYLYNSYANVYLNISKAVAGKIHHSEKDSIKIDSIGDGKYQLSNQSGILGLTKWNVFNTLKNNKDIVNYEFEIYEKTDDAIDSGINGFKRFEGSALEQGKEYIFVINQTGSEKGNYDNCKFIVRPCNLWSDNLIAYNNFHTAIIKNDVDFAKITIDAKSVGTEIVKIDGTTYTINVASEFECPQVNDPQNYFIRKTANVSNINLSNRLSRLTLSMGDSYDVGLNAQGRTDIKWYSSDVSCVTVSWDEFNKTATISAQFPDGFNDKTVNVCVEYTNSSGQVEKHSLPVTIVRAHEQSETSLRLINVYINNIVNSNAYISLNRQKYPGTDSYFHELVKNEAIYVKSRNTEQWYMDFFADAHNGYMLNAMHGLSGRSWIFTGLWNYDTSDPVILSAINNKYDGWFFYSRGANITDGLTEAIDVISTQPPELTKTIYGVKHSVGTGNIVPIEDNSVIFKDDIIYYKITVDASRSTVAGNGVSYWGSEGLKFTQINLTDELEGAYFVNATGEGANITFNEPAEKEKVRTKDILENFSDGNGISNGNIVDYYVAYKITEKDIGRSLKNRAKLVCTYQSQYVSQLTRNSDVTHEANNIKIVAEPIGSTSTEKLPINPNIIPGVKPEDIDMDNGSGSIPLYKTYYVKKGVRAKLNSFADKNVVDCVDNLYIYKSNESKVTSVANDVFIKADDLSMYFTATDKEEHTYIVTYDTYKLDENGQSVEVKKAYAIKIKVIEDKFLGASLNIGNTFDINFYVDIATVNKTDTDANYENVEKKATDFDGDVTTGNYRVEFTKPNGDTQIVNVTYDGKNYKATYSGIYAYQMNEEIKAQLLYVIGNNVVELTDERPYSINRYINNMYRTDAENTEPSTDLQKMLYAMGIYGGYAQRYAKNNWQYVPAQQRVECDFAGNANSYIYDLSLENKFAPDVTITNSKINSAVRLELKEGMGVKLTLILTTDNSINLTDDGYTMTITTDGFNINDNNNNNNSVVITGGMFKVIESGPDGKEYRFEISNIPPFFWGKNDGNNITFELKNAGDTVCEIKYSVLSYCYNMRENEKTDLRNLVKSMYAFGHKANTWYNTRSIQ